jgi:hypothetical protein
MIYLKLEKDVTYYPLHLFPMNESVMEKTYLPVLVSINSIWMFLGDTLQ